MGCLAMRAPTAEHVKSPFRSSCSTLKHCFNSVTGAAVSISASQSVTDLARRLCLHHQPSSCHADWCGLCLLTWVQQSPASTPCWHALTLLCCYSAAAIALLLLLPCCCCCCCCKHCCCRCVSFAWLARTAAPDSCSTHLLFTHTCPAAASVCQIE